MHAQGEHLRMARINMFTWYHRANSAEDAVRRGQRQVEQVKIKMGMQMDDKTFQSSLLETQVRLLSGPYCGSG